MTGTAAGAIASAPPATPLTILLVEDSEIDAALVSRMLAQVRGLRATVTRLARLDEALGALAKRGVDLVLLDLSLPDSRGFETFERVREASPDVPVIVLSSYRDEDLAVTMVRNGAQDYLMKGQVSHESLARSIQYSLERHRMVMSLRGLSLLDELTGLYNRRGFLSLAESHRELARRGGRRLVLLYADLDGLKQINDTYGHREGDLAIIRAAEVLRHSFRHSDVVARLGGDEFVVLAVEAGGDGEQQLVPRLERQLAEFNRGSRLPYEVSMSVGVSSYDPAADLSLDAMLAEADRALYARKAGRRGALRRREEAGVEA